MKAIFWIGCIFLILLGCTGFCMATDAVENGTEAIVETINETSANVTETINTTINQVTPVNVTELVTPGVVPTQQAETVSEDVVPNESPEQITPVAEISAEDKVKDELKTFIADTRMIALKAGKNAAISAFNDRAGPYADPNMPIFAYDITGKVLANPMDLASVGTNQISAADSKGTRYVQMMIDTAKNGEGFAEFMAPNLLKQGKVMKKMVYVSSVDGSWFIGSGVYLDDNAEKKVAVKKEVITPVIENQSSNVTSENLAGSA